MTKRTGWAVTAMVGACSVSFCGAIEPRDYGTYDTFGMIPYESVQKPTPAVSRAMAEEKAGRNQNAADLYWAAVLKDKADTQAVVGLSRCARRIGYSYAHGLRNKVVVDKRFAMSDIPARDWATMLLRGLLSWGTSSLDRGSMSTYLTKAWEWNRKDYCAFLVLWLQNEIGPTEARTALERFRSRYPKVEGFDYYRILSYIKGDLGTYLENPKTGKFERMGLDSDKPEYGKALNLLKRYLGEDDPPTWVHYLAAVAYNGNGNRAAARKHAKLVMAATGESKLLRDWKRLVKNLAD